MSRRNAYSLAILPGVILCQTARADRVDDFIRDQMKKHGIPGVSIAVWQNGKIVKVKAYGVTDAGGRNLVTPRTKFQAASISKLVSAVGTMRLVEQGKLDLDRNVNEDLKSWKLPENAFTAKSPVTVRRILSHTAGIAVSGFAGYAKGKAIPNLEQILEGDGPANSDPIRVDTEPGTNWRYSGGGYVVLRKLIEDLTGTPFPVFMHDTVLQPLGMTESTFDQPLPDGARSSVSAANYLDGAVIPGRYHNYPEIAPDGLWTNPTDLAHFALGVQKSGEPGSILRADTLRTMLTEVKNRDGLGAFLESEGDTLRFGHTGRNEGFDSAFIAYAKSGQGAAVMINANENTGTIGKMLQVIAQAYHWHQYPLLSDVQRPRAIAMPVARLAEFQGRYEWRNNFVAGLRVEQGKLVARFGREYFDELRPSGPDTFFAVDNGIQLHFLRDEHGQITKFVNELLPTKGPVLRAAVTSARIGPLIASLKPQADPNPDLTNRIQVVLTAFSHGGKETAAVTGITEEVRKDFANPIVEVDGFGKVVYVGEESVAGRGIERHHNKVDRILYYRMASVKGSSFVLIYLTADGLVTDLDAVED